MGRAEDFARNVACCGVPIHVDAKTAEAGGVEEYVSVYHSHCFLRLKAEGVKAEAEAEAESTCQEKHTDAMSAKAGGVEENVYVRSHCSLRLKADGVEAEAVWEG